MNSEIPEPSAELVLIRAWMDVTLRRLSAKEQAQIIREMNEEMELRRALGAVTPFRPKGMAVELASERRKAANWWDMARVGLGRRDG